MSSLQRRFGLSTDLTPSVCHSVLLIVHLLSAIRTICPAHFHFVLVTYWTMSVTLVLCLMVVLRILSLSLTLSILLSIARWCVSSFSTNAFVTDHVGQSKLLNLSAADSSRSDCVRHHLHFAEAGSQSSGQLPRDPEDAEERGGQRQGQGLPGFCRRPPILDKRKPTFAHVVRVTSSFAKSISIPINVIL